MPAPVVQFVIDHDPFHQITAWKQESDLAIIRYQIMKRGRAVVHLFAEDRHMVTITEVPRLGEAEPHVGQTGGGISYTFHPLPMGGCDLEVERFALGPFNSYPEPIPLLRLHLHNGPTALNDRSGGALLNARSRYALDPDNEIRFRIDSDEMERFNEWSNLRPVSDFNFIFIPTSVGTIVRFQHRSDGEVLDVTDYDAF